MIDIVETVYEKFFEKTLAPFGAMWAVGAGDVLFLQIE